MDVLSALVGCLSSAFIRRIIYKILNVCPIDYTAFAVSWKVGSRKPVLPHQLGDFVTPTYRHKLVRSRSVSEYFGCVFVLSCCFLDFSVGVGAIVIGLSQIYSFFPERQL